MRKGIVQNVAYKQTGSLYREFFIEMVGQHKGNLKKLRRKKLSQKQKKRCMINIHLQVDWSIGKMNY